MFLALIQLAIFFIERGTKREAVLQFNTFLNSDTCRYYDKNLREYLFGNVALRYEDKI